MWLPFQVVLLLLAIATLVFIILSYVEVRKKCRESFANCFGMQYNGIYTQQNPQAPICPQARTSPYRGGGCVQYDPEKTYPPLQGVS